MTRNARYWPAWTIVVAACATSAWGGGGNALRAYPDAIPEDTNFDSVVKSQPFPVMKYVVNVVGAKVHPEEFHVTSSGQLTAKWRLTSLRPPIDAERVFWRRLHRQLDDACHWLWFLASL
jgi:hypothetical protein